jgi:hypothetical protein
LYPQGGDSQATTEDGGKHDRQDDGRKRLGHQTSKAQRAVGRIRSQLRTIAQVERLKTAEMGGLSRSSDEKQSGS